MYYTPKDAMIHERSIQSRSKHLHQTADQYGGQNLKINKTLERGVLEIKQMQTITKLRHGVWWYYSGTTWCMVVLLWYYMVYGVTTLVLHGVWWYYYGLKVKTDQVSYFKLRSQQHL